MLWSLDVTSAQPLHEQLAGAVRRALGEGSLVADERLPSAKELAGLLGVDPNTVLRAYRTLRDEGLLSFRRGRGVTVTATAPERGAVIEGARSLLALGRSHGLSATDLGNLLKELS